MNTATTSMQADPDVARPTARCVATPRSSSSARHLAATLATRLSTRTAAWRATAFGEFVTFGQTQLARRLMSMHCMTLLGGVVSGGVMVARIFSLIPNSSGCQCQGGGRAGA